MIDYREAKPADAAAVAALHARSWRESYRGEFTDAFLDGDLEGDRLVVWRERLEHPPGNQYVELAFDGDTLIGIVCVYGDHHESWGSFVDNLHVAAETKGKGVGAALMRQAGRWLAERYPDIGVYLLVLESNVAARRFYERLGAVNASVSTMETHGGAIVRSCHYLWPNPKSLAVGSAEGAD